MDWNSIGNVLFGAGIALVSSFIMFGAGIIADRRVRAAEKHRSNAVLAYRAFHTLNRCYNDVANLNRQIGEMFKEAEEIGAVDMEPMMKVRALVGHESEPARIDPEGTYFLIEMKRSPLLNEVNLVPERANNIYAITKKFNELRLDFDAFLLANSDAVELGEGLRAATTLEGNKGIMAEIKVRQLNNLLGHFMEMLDEDEEKMFRTAEEFVEAAQQHFGDDFPKFRFDKVANV